MEYAASTPAGDPADDRQERWDRHFELRYGERWDSAEPEDRIEMLVAVLGSVKVNDMLNAFFFDAWQLALREREGM
jgi:hypothetical protein